LKEDVLNQDQRTDGIRYAIGIRNGMANCWNTNVNELYELQHKRDQLSQFFPEMFFVLNCFVFVF
jgi:glucose/arabinose dehydrogenase